MPTGSSEALVRQYVERVLNRGDLTGGRDLLAANFKRYLSPGGAPIDADGLRQHLADRRAAFPDWHLVLEDVEIYGDCVIFRGTVRATHRGTFEALAPTGRILAVSDAETVRIENGTIAEHWGGVDLEAVLNQLGAGSHREAEPNLRYRLNPVLSPQELAPSGNADCINNVGQITGEVRNGRKVDRAVLWQAGAQIELDARLVGQKGAVAADYPTALKDIVESSAQAINDCGEIAGSVKGATGKTRAYFLQGSGVTTLGTLGDGESVANAINGLGQIVGSSSAVFGQPGQAFLWQRATGMRSLAGPEMVSSSAEGINNAGEVVGSYKSVLEDGNATARRACLWRAGEAIPLASLGGTLSRAHAINNAGQVAGQSDQAGRGGTYAVVWQAGAPAEPPTVLGTLGGSSSRALGLSDDGAIVGQCSDASGFFFAVYWEPGNPSPVKLGGPGTIANHINNHGQIVGRVERLVVNGQETGDPGPALFWNIFPVRWI
jgi:uncharacterized membrane protein/predicted ester cyclase